jgi:hypothetical protein
MRDQPDGEKLLSAAARAFRKNILQEVSKEHRYSALMIARIMDIAERQVAAGDAPERAEKEGLSEILGAKGSLEELNRKLVDKIRTGGFDKDERLRRHLVETTRVRVLESNPKYLERFKVEGR